MAKCRQTADGYNQNDPMALTEFEQARLQRIQRNKQVLASMGLENAAGAMSAAILPKAKRIKHSHTSAADPDYDIKQHGEPARRSKRLAKEPAAVIELGDLYAGVCERRLSSTNRERQLRGTTCCRELPVQQLDTNVHHNHNAHRIKTMSEKALITRAWKITNVSKLQSFVEVLKAAGGFDTVLSEAIAALATLTGQGSQYLTTS